jgi:hypothetical protein
MGFRNGEKLNELCPGLNGPSDIDHIVHNKWHDPEERVCLIEYKEKDVELPKGQRLLLTSLQGDWKEQNTGRLMNIRYRVVHPDEEHLLASIASEVWPGRHV